MYFTEEALLDLKREYEGVPRKHAALMQAYLLRDYRDASRLCAREARPQARLS